jgi:hypothetical protein
MTSVVMLIIEILFIIMLSVVMLNVMAPQFRSFIKTYLFGAWRAACSKLHWDHAASSIGGLLHFQVFAVHWTALYMLPMLPKVKEGWCASKICP